MKTRSFLLAAGIVLALAFTFSCSDGGDPGGGGNVNNGSFTIDFIYDMYTMTCNDDGYDCTGEKWNGNGTVRMEACDDNGLYAGVIVNGTLSLNLPSASEIPQSCFHNATQVFDGAPSDLKIVWGDYDFNVDNGVGEDGEPYNILKWETPAAWENATERIRGRYIYFSKAAKITGGGHSINASEGWNEVYFIGRDAGKATTDLNTIGGVKPIWYIYYNDREN